MASAVTVRPARDDDDLDALNVGSAAWMGQDQQRKLFAVDNGLPKALLVAELDGTPVGYAHAVGHGLTDGHRGIGYVFVPPAHRRRGVGRALWRSVLEVCSPDRVPGIGMEADLNDGTTVDVAVAHGCVARGAHLESELDLASVESLRDLALAPRAPDVEIRPLADDAGEPQWQSFADVFRRLMRDAPDVAAGAEDIQYDILRALLPEPWQVMGAWREGTLVGQTCVSVRDRAARRLNTLLTGVDRELRGRGLATALKARHALALRDAGWRSIVTQNMEGNEAILASNRRMGFRPRGGIRDLTFDHEPSAVG